MPISRESETIFRRNNDLKKLDDTRRPCSDFMDMLRRLISRRIIIIIIQTDISHLYYKHRWLWSSSGAKKSKNHKTGRNKKIKHDLRSQLHTQQWAVMCTEHSYCTVIFVYSFICLSLSVLFFCLSFSLSVWFIRLYSIVYLRGEINVCMYILPHDTSVTFRRLPVNHSHITLTV